MGEVKYKTSDMEFLAFCETHIHTEKAEFVAAQLYRLCVLAGDPHGGTWNIVPRLFITSYARDRYIIIEKIKKARELMKERTRYKKPEQHNLTGQDSAGELRRAGYDPETISKNDD